MSAGGGELRGRVGRGGVGCVMGERGSEGGLVVLGGGGGVVDWDGRDGDGSEGRTLYWQSCGVSLG